MEKEFLDLFPSRIWVRAEVSAVKARNGGHCYMELSQSGSQGLVAKASAVIWASKYRFIAPYFQSVTGSPLSEGMMILVEVQVSYSQLYGFTLVINDIDPEYSLGLREQERQKTIDRLSQEGLLELQQGFQLPLLPHCLAVISAEDAAGYRDFMRHLDENPYGFQFDTELYPALMQGADCPASIIAALDAVMESGRDYDAVLILRGGGAKLDLACYDDYELAAVIAQYPLPVLTAVGHDQDFHVCDMVAYEFVKTPTALADYFLGIYEAEDERLSLFGTRLKLAASNKIGAAEASLQMLRSRIRGGFALKIAAMDSALKVLEARIMSADPRKVIERGYALVLDAEGRALKGARGVSEGDSLSVLFSDGALDCRVENKRNQV